MINYTSLLKANSSNVAVNNVQCPNEGPLSDNDRHAVTLIEVIPSNRPAGWFMQLAG